MSEELTMLTKSVQETVEHVADIKATVEEVKVEQAKIAEMGDLVTGTEAAVGALSGDVADLKRSLAAMYGKSGGEDWTKMAWDWMRSAYFDSRQKARGIAPPEWVKTAADFTIDTGSTGGYMVPDALQPGITQIKDIYGSVYPRVTKVQMPPGHTLKLNSDATHPVGAWRGTQGGAMTEEPTPMAFAQDTLTTELCYVWIKIANELFNAPGVGFGQIAVARMVRAILLALEFGILQGDASGSTQPSDGILIETGPNDQTNISAATLAVMSTFIQESVVDYSFLFDTSQNQILISPAKAQALQAQAVHSTNLPGALTWGSPREGMPATLFGYDLLPHPAMVISTTHWAAMGNLADVILGETGTIGIDFNGLGTGWESMETYLRVYEYYDWGFKPYGNWSKADFS